MRFHLFNFNVKHMPKRLCLTPDDVLNEAYYQFDTNVRLLVLN